MNLKPISAMAAIAVAILMTTPASGQLPPLLSFSAAADGENSSWTTDGEGNWWNDPTADTYNNYECSYLETSPIPGPLALLGPLTFDYTHSIETNYDASAVIMTVDGGETWTQVASGLENSELIYTYPANCLASFGIEPTEVITGTGDGSASIDLSAAGTALEFQVRLVLASDYCCIYNGWEISNIAIAGQPIN